MCVRPVSYCLYPGRCVSQASIQLVEEVRTFSQDGVLGQTGSQLETLGGLNPGVVVDCKTVSPRTLALGSFQTYIDLQYRGCSRTDGTRYLSEVSSRPSQGRQQGTYLEQECPGREQ